MRKFEQEYLIRGIGRAQTVDQIAEHVVTTRDGTAIKLAQIADVKVGPALAMGDAIVNGKPAVLINVSKQPWSNTLVTTREVEHALSELSQALPADVKVVTVFRQADFIEVGVHNVLEALAMGGLLVAAILFVFLWNWRTAMISLLAIPVSLLVSVIVLHWQGMTINTMTLAGLAIAIGEVVDDAIIDVENVYKRLRENALCASPANPVVVIFRASCEIRSSVVYATAIVCLVFLPIFALSGLEGKIFVPLAASYITAIAASLVVALTLTPALCHLLLAGSAGNETSTGQADETKIVQWLARHYEKLLSLALTYPGQTLKGAGLFFLLSLIPLGFLGNEFLPQFDESNLVVSITAPPGTSLDTTSRIGTVLTAELSSQDFVGPQDKGPGAHADRMITSAATSVNSTSDWRNRA